MVSLPLPFDSFSFPTTPLSPLPPPAHTHPTPPHPTPPHPTPPHPTPQGIRSVAATAPIGSVGSFYLRPTCVGLTTSRPFPLLNGSRLPLRYRVTIEADGQSQGVVSVTPAKGILRGNEGG